MNFDSLNFILPNFKERWFFSFISLQTIIALFAVLGFYCVQDTFAGLSALLGAIIAIVPNFIFIPVFSLSGNAGNPKLALSNFYLALGLKWFISILLFTLAFQWGKLRALALFASFIAIQLTYWLFSVVQKATESKVMPFLGQGENSYNGTDLVQ